MGTERVGVRCPVPLPPALRGYGGDRRSQGPGGIGRALGQAARAATTCPSGPTGRRKVPWEVNLTRSYQRDSRATDSASFLDHGRRDPKIRTWIQPNLARGKGISPTASAMMAGVRMRERLGHRS